jgi:hypothetical protein
MARWRGTKTLRTTGVERKGAWPVETGEPRDVGIDDGSKTKHAARQATDREAIDAAVGKGGREAAVRGKQRGDRSRHMLDRAFDQDQVESAAYNASSQRGVGGHTGHVDTDRLQDRCRIAIYGPNHERAFAGRRLSLAEQATERGRRHHRATVGEPKRAIEIGQGLRLVGNILFARHRPHRGEHAAIDHAFGAKLAVDHRPPGEAVILHLVKPLSAKLSYVTNTARDQVAPYPLRSASPSEAIPHSSKALH